DGLRRGTIRARARTQSSIAVSGNNTDWILFNASPDILAQLRAFPELQPGRTLRDTAVRAVVLMDAQIDHTTGLFMLREGQPLEIYSTDMAREDLTTGNPVFNILQHYCGIHWHRVPIDPGIQFPVIGAGDLNFMAAALARKAPPHPSPPDPPRPRRN